MTSGHVTSVALICGLAAEARIAAAHGLPVACSGSDPERAGVLARRLVRSGARALVSFGIAGGLDPALRAGDLVVATHVVADGVRWSSSPAWCERIADVLPGCRRGIVAGSTAMVGDSAAKRDLHASTGALIVDLESQAVAETATALGVPFLGLRAVVDTADQTIPAVVATMVRADGRVAMGRVAMALAARPGLIVTLGMLALANRRALASLATAAAAIAAEVPD